MTTAKVLTPEANSPSRPPNTTRRPLYRERWYLRYGLSNRDVEELLAERGVDVDHVTVHRWVQRFTPLLVDAARFGRHRVGDRWHVDETYVALLTNR
jgi:transposase-like protein